MSGWTGAAKKVAAMTGGGKINWFPGHMAAATRAIRNRLKFADLVVEVRDARIPLTSANEDLQSVLSSKRRVIALNKMDLTNSKVMHRWVHHFEMCKQDCIPISAHNKRSVDELLVLVERKLKERISTEPTLLVMVIGVPNVGKSALINSIHQIANARFRVQEKMKRATVGPFPGVTQDIAGYKIANHPSIYVLDTPGVLVPSIPDIETGLKLALTGAIKDSVVGETRLAEYLLAVLNTWKTPLQWEHLHNKNRGQATEFPGHNESNSRGGTSNRGKTVYGSEDVLKEVQKTLYTTFYQFNGNLEEECELESLIEIQLIALRKPFRLPDKAEDGSHLSVSKKLLVLFRTGKLGPFILDSLPGT